MAVVPDSHSRRNFALLYASAAERPVLEALIGIEREVFGSVRVGLDHHVAHSRLQWWQEECVRAADGRAVHPLTKALVCALAGSTAGSKGLAALGTPELAGLSGLVDGAIWDLAGATFETRREMDAYCERWAAGMIEPLLARWPASPMSDTQTNDWRVLGAAMRELELLTELAREAHYGRIRVPLDELESAHVDTAVLAIPPWSDGVANILRVRHKSLRNNIQRILVSVDRERQTGLRGLLVWAALVSRSSVRAERALPDGLYPRRLDAISDAWFAWRIARRATIGRFRLD